MPEARKGHKRKKPRNFRGPATENHYMKVLITALILLALILALSPTAVAREPRNPLDKRDKSDIAVPDRRPQSDLLHAAERFSNGTTMRPREVDNVRVHLEPTRAAISISF